MIVTETGEKRKRAPLLPQHRADLQRSGLSDEQIAACQFYSETDPTRVVALLGTHVRACAKQFGPCLILPYLDANGAPNGYFRLKPDHPRKNGKKDGKSIKYEGPAGRPNRAYVPPGTRAALTDPTAPLLLVEGEKKAAACDQHGFACVGIPGVWAWQLKRPKDEHGRGAGPRELIPDLAGIAWAGRAVTIVFDSDVAEKAGVQLAERHLAAALAALGARVRVARLPNGPSGEKWGADDFLVHRGPDEFRAVLDAALPADAACAAQRPQIVVGPDEHRVNEEAVAALASEPDLYQRGGVLVRLATAEPEPEPDAVVRRPAGAPVLRALPPALLRERLTHCADWVRFGTDGEEELVPVHPPAWAVSAVHARGVWPGVRHLAAVVEHPVLLPDGTLLDTNGYHAGTRLLLSVPPNLTLRVPSRPTVADTRAAVARVSEVMRDFPFAAPAHRAAWFAGLLTPLAWFTFAGPAPLLLIDANVRAAGKGLLADVLALIVTGRRFSIMNYTPDREELRKRITALAMEGERMVLLDNLAGAVGNDVLDAALTGDRWKDRVLGASATFDGPLNVFWCGTGNNVQLAADTARRVSHCRLESPHERPELRADVTHTNLRGHVRAHRAELLSAALTILRAWHVAGRPKHRLAPWGSFEGWSAVVREAVVFAGLPDPGETREALQATADRDSLAMNAVLDALEQMDPGRRGVTVAQVMDRVKPGTEPAPEWVPALRTAIIDLCEKLDGRTLGARFRQFQRRNFGGRALQKDGADRTHAGKWVVVSVGAPAAPTETDSSSPSCPAPTVGSAGHEGLEGPVLAQPNSARARAKFSNDDRPHNRRGVA